MEKQKIPAAPSIRRLPSYLHAIRRIQHEGSEYISGTLIAQELNLEPIQVRKDLSITGIIGKPQKGYPVKALVNAIERFLGWTSVRDAALVGVGNLGCTLIGHQEFRFLGLNIMAAFDTNPQKIGTTVYGVKILPVETLESRLRYLNIKIAILTLPAPYAQETTDILINAGIEGIWNFTNVKLKVPPGVIVQTEDLSSGYAMLCVMLQAKYPERDP